MKAIEKTWSKNWEWGRLQDHVQTCPECDGSGVEDYDPDDPPSDDEATDECHICRGERDLRWGSFYAEDNAHCEKCDDGEDKPVGRMFDGCISWVCLPCYLKMHATECGCRQWRQAESEVIYEG